MIARFVIILVLALVCVAVTACRAADVAAPPAAAAGDRADAASSSASADRQRWSENASWAPGRMLARYRASTRSSVTSEESYAKVPVISERIVATDGS